MKPIRIIIGIMLVAGVAIGISLLFDSHEPAYPPFVVICDKNGHYAATGRYGSVMDERSTYAEAKSDAEWYRKNAELSKRHWHVCKEKE